MLLVGCIMLLSPGSQCMAEGKLPGQWFGSSLRAMTETTDGYYMIVNGYLYYFDPETFVPEIVCSRLNCLHQNEEEQSDCDAFTLGSCLTQLDDHLYYDEIDTFGRMLPDGTNHEEWMPAPWTLGAQQYPYGFYGKYFIYIDEFIDTTNELNLQIKDLFYTIDISRPQNQSILIEEWDGTQQALMPVQITDNALYYIIGTNDGEKQLWSFDLKTQEKTQLYQTTEAANYYCNGTNAYMLQANKGVYLIDLNTKEKKILLTKDEENTQYTRYYCDGRYIYSIAYNEDTNACTVSLFDMNGQALSNNIIPSSSSLYMIAENDLLFRSNDRRDVPETVVSLASLLQDDPIVKKITIPEWINQDSYDENQ